MVVVEKGKNNILEDHGSEKMAHVGYYIVRAHVQLPWYNFLLIFDMFVYKMKV